ncbi:MAG: glycosyltransferase family 4 protein [Maribacter arcticus]|uniref:glycosyltransferase family 4 protein n=1 Tax=Maribacter arcticus TaxID=561365 RepID=UPI00300242C0
MKKSVTYFGNKTSGFSGTTATMETLEPLLGEFCQIRSFSHISNKLVRLLHMTYGFFRYGVHGDAIIVDVYSTSAFYYALWISSLAKIFGPRELILVLHGGNLPNLYTFNTKRVTTLFNRATCIIAPSHYLKNFFEEQGFKLTLIPNIIQLEQYPFKERSVARPKILALRGFKLTYNPLMTLRAVRTLLQNGVAVEVLLLGNEDEEGYQQVMHFISENRMEKSVTVMPKQDKSTWIEMSKAYDIMISNPVIDNTPVSIIEGMALGMCVVTTNVGGVPFICEDGKNAVFIENNDDEGLADCIAMLLKDRSLAATLSTNGRLMAAQYDWAQVKQEWKRILINQ